MEILRAILARARGRTWGDRACRTLRVLGAGWLSFLLGPGERERGGVVREPGGWQSGDLQSLQCHRPTHPVQMGGQHGIQALASSVIVERRGGQAGLQEGQPASLLPTPPHLRESMMAIQQRQEQRLALTATREDIGRGRRAEGRDERRHLELADHTQHQRQVGHGTALMNRDRQEGLLQQILPEGASERISFSGQRLAPCLSKKSLYSATTP